MTMTMAEDDDYDYNEDKGYHFTISHKPSAIGHQLLAIVIVIVFANV